MSSLRIRVKYLLGQRRVGIYTALGINESPLVIKPEKTALKSCSTAEERNGTRDKNLVTSGVLCDTGKLF
jgi:hypothetical protein